MAEQLQGTGARASLLKVAEVLDVYDVKKQDQDRKRPRASIPRIQTCPMTLAQRALQIENVLEKLPNEVHVTFDSLPCILYDDPAAFQRKFEQWRTGLDRAKKDAGRSGHLATSTVVDLTTDSDDGAGESASRVQIKGNERQVERSLNIKRSRPVVHEKWGSKTFTIMGDFDDCIFSKQAKEIAEKSLKPENVVFVQLDINEKDNLEHPEVKIWMQKYGKLYKHFTSLPRIAVPLELGLKWYDERDIERFEDLQMLNQGTFIGGYDTFVRFLYAGSRDKKYDKQPSSSSS